MKLKMPSSLAFTDGMCMVVVNARIKLYTASWKRRARITRWSLQKQCNWWSCAAGSRNAWHLCRLLNSSSRSLRCSYSLKHCKVQRDGNYNVLHRLHVCCQSWKLLRGALWTQKDGCSCLMGVFERVHLVREDAVHLSQPLQIYCIRMDYIIV